MMGDYPRFRILTCQISFGHDNRSDEVALGARKLAAVGTLPLVGGALCLDFVNTTGARDSGFPRERLGSYDDLLVWSLRAKVLSPDDAARLRVAATMRVEKAEEVLRRIRELREELYRLFRSVAEGREPSPDSVARLSVLWREERSRRYLVSERGGFALRLQNAEDELDPMLWPIIASAADFLLSDRIARLKRCGECDWLFADMSRNGTRTWCKKACGDRVRARHHYARTRRPKDVSR